jgi:hypothetical protein
MKVIELIKELQRMPEDDDVVLLVYCEDTVPRCEYAKSKDIIVNEEDPFTVSIEG